MTGAGRRSSASGLARTAGPLSPRGLAAAGGSGVLSAVCAVGLLATSGWLLTRASQRPPVFDLAIAIGAVQALALGRGVTRYLQRLAVHGLALETLSRLRLWLYDTVEPLVPDGLRGERTRPSAPATTTGSLLSGFVADTEETTEALARGVTVAIDLGASVVLGAVVAALLAPPAAAALLAGAAGVVVLASLASRLGRSAAVRAAELRAELAGQVVETLRSAPELLAFGRQDLVEERLERSRRLARASALRGGLGTGAARALATWAAGAGLVGVVLTGLAAHRSGQLSGIGLTVLVLVALAALDQGSALPAALAGRSGGNAAASRLARLSGLEPPAREPATDTGPPAGPVGAALDHVEVNARDGAATVALLRDVSLQVRPRGRLAISGAQRVGQVDGGPHPPPLPGARGRNRQRRRRRRAPDDPRGHGPPRGLAGRGDPSLRRSPRRQPAPGPPRRDRRRVHRGPRPGRARRLAALAPGWPGDGAREPAGRPTSAGERQRLGMARALLSGAELLLLDEPTAHLDPGSSSRVLAELLGAAGSRSVLVVSHDPELVGEVDAVVVLEEGRVVSGGPPH